MSYTTVRLTKTDDDGNVSTIDVLPSAAKVYQRKGWVLQETTTESNEVEVTDPGSAGDLVEGKPIACIQCGGIHWVHSDPERPLALFCKDCGEEDPDTKGKDLYVSESLSDEEKEAAINGGGEAPKGEAASESDL